MSLSTSDEVHVTHGHHLRRHSESDVVDFAVGNRGVVSFARLQELLGMRLDLARSLMGASDQSICVADLVWDVLAARGRTIWMRNTPSSLTSAEASPLSAMVRRRTKARPRPV